MTNPGAQPYALPISTTFEIPGRPVQRSVGSCFGLVARSMGFGRQIGASFKALSKGKVSEYTELLEDSRRHAIDRLVENSQLLGGNAIVGMRFDSSEIGQN